MAATPLLLPEKGIPAETLSSWKKLVAGPDQPPCSSA